MKRRTTSVIATAFTALAICCSLTTAAQENDTFWLGADISGTTALEKHNMPLYDVKGQPCENTQLMKAPEAEGHYRLGAIRNHRPTAIMDAFNQ